MKTPSKKKLVFILDFLIGLIVLSAGYFIWLLIPPRPNLERIKVETFFEKNGVWIDQFLLSPDKRNLVYYDASRDRIMLFNLANREEKILQERIWPFWIYVRGWLNNELIYGQIIERKGESFELFEDTWKPFILNISDLSQGYLINVFDPQSPLYRTKRCILGEKENRLILPKEIQKEIIKNAKLVFAIDYSPSHPEEVSFCVDEIYKKYRPIILALDSHYSGMHGTSPFQIFSPEPKILIEDTNYLSVVFPQIKIKLGEKIYSPDRRHYFILTNKNPLLLGERSLYLEIFQENGKSIGRYVPSFEFFSTYDLNEYIAFWVSNNEILLKEAKGTPGERVIKKISF